MPDQYRPLTSSLRTRLLIITVIFVLVVEVFVYMPSIATFREGFIEQRLAAAQIAALSLEEAPGYMVSPELERNLLASSGVIAIAIRRKDRSHLLGFDQMPLEVNASYDIRNNPLGVLVSDAFDTLTAKGERIIRVIGRPNLEDTRWIEITMDEAPLYEAMSAYSNNLLLLSVFISISTGLLVYLTLHWSVVRPMRRVKHNIARFRERPEDASRNMMKSKRRDEIGIVERELARMQTELRHSLTGKAHLAELGEAVSKINHDLRNMLATAQISAEALESVKDPRVKKVTTRMVNATKRAITLCERTLKHGKAVEPDPKKEQIGLHDVVEDVAFALDMDKSGLIFENNVDQADKILADSDQLFRVLLNLCRNAMQAQPDGGLLRLTLNLDDAGDAHINVIDGGPGITAEVQTNLFKPFLATTRSDGTGLGLSIAREIVEAHGGRLSLAETSDKGSVFMICLPAGDYDLNKSS